jgi:hypothetical protein
MRCSWRQMDQRWGRTLSIFVTRNTRPTDTAGSSTCNYFDLLTENLFDVEAESPTSPNQHAIPAYGKRECAFSGAV